MEDPRVEQFLRRGKYRWKYVESVPLSEIDLVGSLANEGRLDHRLDDVRVEEMALALQAGVQFPAILLLPNGNDKYLVPTGLHRLSAAQRAHRRTIDAYIIREKDELRREILFRQANSIEGIGDTPASKLHQALELARRWPNRTLASIAQEMFISATRLGDARRIEDLERRANDSGLTGFRCLHHTVKLKLGTIKNERCFIQASQVAETLRSSVEACAFIKEVAAAAKRSERGGIEVCEAKRRLIASDAKMAKAKVGRVKTTAAVKFLGHCKDLNRLVPDGVIRILHLSTLPDIEDSRAAVQATIELLTVALAEFDKLLAEDDPRA